MEPVHYQQHPPARPRRGRPSARRRRMRRLGALLAALAACLAALPAATSALQVPQEAPQTPDPAKQSEVLSEVATAQQQTQTPAQKAGAHSAPPQPPPPSHQSHQSHQSQSHRPAQNNAGRISFVGGAAGGELNAAPAQSAAPTAPATATAAAAGAASNEAAPIPMSCIACTTMDYENEEDNICRNGAASALYQHYHRQLKQPHHLMMSLSPSPSSHAPHHYNASTASAGAPANQSQLLGGPASAGPHKQTAAGQSAASAGHLLGHALRLRPCVGEEHFCSVVSVVRMFYENEKLVTKFWGLERNCSKGCTTGCMIIGERVRLRVCSQCCRTPNCNTAGAATGSPMTASRARLMAAAGVSLVAGWWAQMGPPAGRALLA